MIPKEAMVALFSLVAVSAAFGYAFNGVVKDWLEDWNDRKNEGVIRESEWEDDIYY